MWNCVFWGGVLWYLINQVVNSGFFSIRPYIHPCLFSTALTFVINSYETTPKTAWSLYDSSTNSERDSTSYFVYTRQWLTVTSVCNNGTKRKVKDVISHQSYMLIMFCYEPECVCKCSQTCTTVVYLCFEAGEQRLLTAVCRYIPERPTTTQTCSS